ncbi:hypothetical protein AYI69_g5834 [Smittium culicis]|uniref:Uncharacterized protein n=1 Tax=Smittium culicis TaxID=133412 RepID=A0A1R1Y3G1_9FUNG|nr:hypothetical protein AYI69_g5834 [Smittium culicis]
MKYIAIASCKADNPSELDFFKDQILINVKSSDEPGWLIGTLEGTEITGMFPENYVEVLKTPDSSTIKDNISSSSVKDSMSLLNDLKSELKYETTPGLKSDSSSKAPSQSVQNATPARETTYSKNIKDKIEAFSKQEPNPPKVSTLEKPKPKPNPPKVSTLEKPKPKPDPPKVSTSEKPKPKPDPPKVSTSEKPKPKPNPKPSTIPVLMKNSANSSEKENLNTPTQSVKDLSKAFNNTEISKSNSQQSLTKIASVPLKAPPSMPSKPPDLAPKPLINKKLPSSISSKTIPQNQNALTKPSADKVAPNLKPKFLTPKPTAASTNTNKDLKTGEFIISNSSQNKGSSTSSSNSEKPTENPFSSASMDIFAKRILESPKSTSDSPAFDSNESSTQSSRTNKNQTNELNISNSASYDHGRAKNSPSLRKSETLLSSSHNQNRNESFSSKPFSKQEINQAFSVNQQNNPPSLPKRSLSTKNDIKSANSINSSTSPFSSNRSLPSRKPSPPVPSRENTFESTDSTFNQVYEKTFESTGTFGGTIPINQENGSLVNVDIGTKFPNGSLAKLGDGECMRYIYLFNKLTKKKASYLSQEQVLPILTKTSLKAPEIERVWQMADLDRDNKLSKCEFILAMWLVDFFIIHGFVPNEIFSDDLSVAFSYQ